MLLGNVMLVKYALPEAKDSSAFPNTELLVEDNFPDRTPRERGGILQRLIHKGQLVYEALVNYLSKREICSWVINLFCFVAVGAFWSKIDQRAGGH